MELVGCPETLVRNYHSMPGKIKKVQITVLRYKYQILVTCHPDTLYLCEQGCEGPLLFFEATRGLWANMFGKHWLSSLLKNHISVKTCYTHTHTHTHYLNKLIPHWRHLFNLHWKHVCLLGQMGNILCVRIKFFWDVTVCHWVSGSWYFEGRYYHHLEGAFCSDWLPK